MRKWLNFIATTLVHEQERVKRTALLELRSYRDAGRARAVHEILHEIIWSSLQRKDDLKATELPTSIHMALRYKEKAWGDLMTSIASLMP